MSWGGVEQRGPHADLESPRELMLALGCRRGQGCAGLSLEKVTQIIWW